MFIGYKKLVYTNSQIRMIFLLIYYNSDCDKKQQITTDKVRSRRNGMQNGEIKKEIVSSVLQIDHDDFHKSWQKCYHGSISQYTVCDQYHHEDYDYHGVLVELNRN